VKFPHCSASRTINPALVLQNVHFDEGLLYRASVIIIGQKICPGDLKEIVQPIMTCFHVVNPVKLHTKGVRILHSIYDVILKYVAMLVPYYYSGTSHNGGGHGSALWHLKLLSYDGLSM